MGFPCALQHQLSAANADVKLKVSAIRAYMCSLLTGLMMMYMCTFKGASHATHSAAERADRGAGPGSERHSTNGKTTRNMLSQSAVTPTVR